LNIFQQDASASDIRRAYRKLSLQLHPDKNKEPDAEIKFRQVMVGAEIPRKEDILPCPFIGIPASSTNHIFLFLIFV